AVDLAPEALRPPWRVALEVRLAVERLANAVDPSPAERDVERLLPRDARDPRGLLEDADPDLLRAVVVPAQPALERLLVPEALDGGGVRDDGWHRGGTPGCSLGAAVVRRPYSRRR